jgi:hypothetical protein
MQASGLNRNLEKAEGLSDEDSFPKNHNVLEKVTLNSDSSELIIDGQTFGGKFDSESVDTDALLSWLYAGSSIGEQLLAWNRMIDERSNQCVDLIQALGREFNSLQNSCERKLEQLRNEEAFISVEGLFCEEQTRREQVGRYGFQTFEELLRKRQEELLERNTEEQSDSNRSEIDAISAILKELHTSHFGYDETLSGMAPRLYDFDGAEEDEWRLHDFIHPNDSMVHMVVSKMKEQVSMEVSFSGFYSLQELHKTFKIHLQYMFHNFFFCLQISKVDAKIMRNFSMIRQLELKLGSVSALDYRMILLPLMRSFLQVRTHHRKFCSSALFCTFAFFICQCLMFLFIA